MDRIPWFAWSPGTPAEIAVDFYRRWQPDAVVVSSSEDVGEVMAAAPGVAVLVEVGNPFGAALMKAVDLNAEFEKGPQDGETAFGTYLDDTQRLLDGAMQSGADGVLYRLFGAEPSLSTPMQFGGLYLEHERELLAGIQQARVNIMYAEGGEGLYLDVISDLPAHALAWDEDRSLITPQQARTVRRGALACGLLSEDPMRLYRDIGGSGLILSGKVDDLLSFNFEDIVSATQTVAEAYR